jgi:Flp pilus assembly pilin Flp
MLNALASYGTVLAWCGLKVMMNGYASREGACMRELIASADFPADDGDQTLRLANESSSLAHRPAVSFTGEKPTARQFNPISRERMKLCQSALLAFLHDCRGQDFVEYALMAGFVAAMAAAVDPTVFNSVRTLWTPVISVMTASGSQS